MVTTFIKDEAKGSSYFKIYTLDDDDDDDDGDDDSDKMHVTSNMIFSSVRSSILTQ